MITAFLKQSRELENECTMTSSCLTHANTCGANQQIIDRIFPEREVGMRRMELEKITHGEIIYYHLGQEKLKDNHGWYSCNLLCSLDHIKS